jgi:pimeloyl-ACP methyl ester carboxylesterase
METRRCGILPRIALSTRHIIVHTTSDDLQPARGVRADDREPLHLKVPELTIYIDRDNFRLEILMDFHRLARPLPPRPADAKLHTVSLSSHLPSLEQIQALLHTDAHGCSRSLRCPPQR